MEIIPFESIGEHAAKELQLAISNYHLAIEIAPHLVDDFRDRILDILEYSSPTPLQVSGGNIVSKAEDGITKITPIPDYAQVVVDIFRAKQRDRIAA